MKTFSQQFLKVAATEPEHLVRKVELDRKIAVGVEIEQLPNGRSNVRLLDGDGQPTGNIVRNVIVLPVSTKATFVTGIDELINLARKDNPLNPVVIE